MHFPLFLCLYESFWKGFESDPAALKYGIRNPESGNGITETETESVKEGSKRSI